MRQTLLFLSLLLVTEARCVAQNGLVLHGTGTENWQAEAHRVYESACLAVQRESRIVDPTRPKITLIVGAHENRAYTECNEIRAINWDPELFAQGVVVIAFHELLTESKRISVAKRTLIGATSVVDARALAKDYR